jgi:hypothetical protein
LPAAGSAGEVTPLSRPSTLFVCVMKPAFVLSFFLIVLGSAFAAEVDAQYWQFLIDDHVIAELRGKTVVLFIEMLDADLYSFRLQ